MKKPKPTSTRPASFTDDLVRALVYCLTNIALLLLAAWGVLWVFRILLGALF